MPKGTFSVIKLLITYLFIVATMTSFLPSSFKKFWLNQSVKITVLNTMIESLVIFDYLKDNIFTAIININYCNYE